MQPYFVGAHDLVIDPKNRISIPSSVRAELRALAAEFSPPAPDAASKDVTWADGSLFVLPGDRREILAIYEAGYFKHVRLGLPPTQQLSRHVRDWGRFEAGLTSKIEPDGQGRVVIPDRLMKISKLTRDVTLVGAVDHYEIWSRAEYLTFLESKLANFDENYEKTLVELAPFRLQPGTSRT
ncbi:MAG: hypothetical protein HZB38_04645 [Planctomycetes bacterium]|nr:hypothetical protein [Planctomycetota bacterium]